MSQIDVLSVGDVVTDAFIKLLDDQAYIQKNDHGSWLTMQFATKLPFDHAEVVEAVGNASNASVSFARLGLKGGLVANVGGDQYGRNIINALHQNGVDTRYVKINPDQKSNYHYVLWYKEERTILIKHEAYEYHWPNLRPDEMPRWIYFSSISKNALPFHDDLSEWLEQHEEVKLAFQPGTFQIETGTERLARLYRRCEVLLVNKDEAVKVGGGNRDDLNDLFSRLHKLGPRIVIITDGPAGAYASSPDGRYKMPAYPDPKPPFERTGAGDAFSSTFVAALAKGNTVEGALQWAPINAMNVVQYVGAQKGLLNEQQIGELLGRAPEWYKPSPL